MPSLESTRLSICAGHAEHGDQATWPPPGWMQLLGPRSRPGLTKTGSRAGAREPAKYYRVNRHAKRGAQKGPIAWRQRHLAPQGPRQACPAPSLASSKEDRGRSSWWGLFWPSALGSSRLLRTLHRTPTVLPESKHTGVAFVPPQFDPCKIDIPQSRILFSALAPSRPRPSKAKKQPPSGLPAGAMAQHNVAFAGQPLCATSLRRRLAYHESDSVATTRGKPTTPTCRTDTRKTILDTVLRNLVLCRWARLGLL